MNTPEGGGSLRRPIAMLVLLGALAGCVEAGLERGFSGRDQEWARGHSPDDFAIVTASHTRAVVSALGNQVAVEPADGFCLASEAIETSDRSAFILLGDCALENPEGIGSGEGALDLPPGVPGIITVSISGDPGFSRRGGSVETLVDLQAFLESAEGRELLGRGGDGDDVSIVDTRRIGDILYVLVEDTDGRVPVLAPRFWRAFVELNERLAVVTVSGFRDRPLAEEEMLRYLGDQVRQLKVANSESLDEIAVQVAETPRRSMPAPVSAASTASALPAEDGEEVVDAGAGIGAISPALPIVDMRPTSVVVATEEGEEFFWPVPQRRGWGNAGQGGPAIGNAERLATMAAPLRRVPEPSSWAGFLASGTTAASDDVPAPAPRR